MNKINILLIGNSQLKKYFSLDSFNVIIPNFQNGYYISNICTKYQIDVIFQVENLSKREIIYDINDQSCLKIFWAIDIHLNFYWQKEYFKNFDIIFSSQYNFVSKINKLCYWIPWGMPDEDISKDFVLFKNREHKISFVGLIDENRAKRKKIINLVSNNFNLNLAGDSLKTRLDYKEMLKIYRNSSVVINESINKEINFRYFETTAQGALLYSEKINNGEEILFQNKKEAFFFSQCNLLVKLKHIFNNIAMWESIAYAGWEKTKRFHKLSNRIEIIQEIIFTNLNKGKKQVKAIDFPLMTTYLRGIGEPFYKKDFIKLAKNQIFRCLFIKSFDEKLFYQELERDKSKNNNLLIQLNQLSNFETAVKFIKSNYNKIPLYYTGYINKISKNRMFLTLYELISYMFSKYPELAKKNKTLNYIGGKILFENSNIYDAIFHFINLQREFPENILFRKYLAACYFYLYEIDLCIREILKIYLLERKFNDFKKFKSKKSLKKEIIFEITTNIKDKRLIRDIIFYLNEFYKDDF